MSTHNHDDNHRNDQELVESSGIKAKPILIFLGALAAATALVFVIIKGMEYGLKKVDELDQKQPATQMDAGRKLPAEPRLQGAPEPDPDNPGQVRPSKLPLDDMAEYRKHINEKAAEYEWVDKQGGIARIPIEFAKELIVENSDKALPKLSATAISEIETAEKTRREVYNSDSNAGRGIKSAKPVATPKTGEPAPAASQPAGAAEKTAPTPIPAAPAAKAAAAGKH